MSLHRLLAVPIATYVLSYVHLAVYHDSVWIWSTVIHEGGKYTLLETTFYASHFLGHVPVHTALALVLVGCNRALGREPDPLPRGAGGTAALGAVIIAFLAFCYWLSLEVFGATDTHDFISQSRQSVSRLEDGGSWKLHLPSTMTMFLVIPTSVIVCRLLASAGAGLRWHGLGMAAAGVGLVAACTLRFDPTPLSSLREVWTDPRYLAHSVREIATFPLTYFAPAMYFLLRRRETANPVVGLSARRLGAGLAVVVAALCAYQCIVPLTAGSIGEIAQKPSFAHDGELGVVYLLTSHYFEHFLDTVYFVLLCLFLDGVTAPRVRE